MATGRLIPQPANRCGRYRPIRPRSWVSGVHGERRVGGANASGLTVAIPGVTESRNDEGFLIQLLIQRRKKDGHLGMLTVEQFRAGYTSKQGDQTNAPGTTGL